MMTTKRTLLALALALTTACGGGSSAGGGGGGGNGTITGRVTKGAVSNATVTVYRLDATMTRGATLGTDTTESDGTFSIEIPPYNGALEIVATGGTYVEESLGSPVALSGHSLTLVDAAYKTGTTLDITISPFSTLAASFARYHVGKGSTLSAALAEAWTHVNAHFGGVNWKTVQPASLTSTGVTNLSPEAIAGLFLAGLSHQAMLLAEDGGVTPGTSTTGATLSSAAAADAAYEGTLNGSGAQGTLTQAGITLDSQTFRRGLGQALLLFVQSTKNKSALQLNDVKPLAVAVAGSSDPYLFCPNQTAADTCAGGTIDIDPPQVAFVSPTPGSGVRGTVSLTVTATDASRVLKLQFTSPAGVVPAAPTFEDNDRTATLTGSLDVSALADGPLSITVLTEDEFHNAKSYTLNVTVANRGPAISVANPTNAATVSGTAQILATASAQTPGATITNLLLVSPVPGTLGFGLDALPAADSLAISWDTTKSPEGQNTLLFRALDTFGSTTDVSRLVTVDNVPFGVLKTHVSAGAPIAGATIQIFAVNAGGQTNTMVGVNGLLGSGGPTDAAGYSQVTLTAENYEGPIRVVAHGSSLSYVDPSDGITTISIPTSFRFSCFIPNYKTGALATIPLTLWTTLADAEALAFAQGLHPSYPTTHSLVSALDARDVLFEKHIVKTDGAWDIRTTVPVRLTGTPQTLRDAVYAELFDIGLNQLGRDTALAAGFGNSTTVINAISLTTLLLQDVSADGQFDGKGAAGQQLVTPGSTPVSLNANTLRSKLANALDAWIFSSHNKSGLTRSDLTNAGVYDTIANDVSDLFGSLPPEPFDNTPPQVTVSAVYGANLSPVGATKLVSGTVTLTVQATDASGIAAIVATATGGASLTKDTARSTATTYVGTWDTNVSGDGALTFNVSVSDTRFNITNQTYSVTVDNTVPSVTEIQPAPGTYYSATVPLELTATDSGGVASLVVEGLTAFVDQDSSPTRLFGSWAIPGTQVDGPASYVIRACDAVGNCTNTSRAVHVDRTAPSVSLATTPAALTAATSVAITVTATDAGAGVKQVYVQNGNAPAHLAARSGSTNQWNVTVPLNEGLNNIYFWGDDNASPTNSGITARSQTTITRDTTAPAITVSAVFGASAKNPVGAAKVVSGWVTLTADVTDASAVASITANMEGIPVARDATLSTATRFVGNYSTIVDSDGAHAFTVVARDQLGNEASQALTLTFDNTPPTVNVTAPVAGKQHSLSASIAANASDANGVASLIATGLPGFADADSSAAGLAGTWSAFPAAPPADTTVIGNASACDVADNCKSAPITIEIDRTPPTLAWHTTPPAVTKTNPVPLYITAADTRSGVGAVKVQIDSGSPQNATYNSSTERWEYAATLTAGSHTITAWAEDQASTPNSGKDLGSPHKLVHSVLFDSLAPTINYNAVASYFDERNMVVATDGNGEAIVPPSYTYASTTKNTIASLGHIYKVASRLTWATTPTASVLESTNPDNIPFLQFTIPYNASAESAITTVTAQVACSGCPNPAPVAVPVLLSPTSSSSQNVYDIPLAANSIPGLSQVTGTAVLTVALSATDAAGNTGTSSNITVYFHVLGPPVAFVEDGGYAASGDPKAVGTYTVANGNYHLLYDAAATTFAPEGQVRVIRYIITNPASVPVAISASLQSGSVAVLEDWLGAGEKMTTDYTLDGFTFSKTARYKASTSTLVPSTCLTPSTCAAVFYGPHPCGADFNTLTPSHVPGATSQFTCTTGFSTKPANQLDLAPTTTPLAALVGYLPAFGQYDSVKAQALSGGQIVVPAASGGVPGKVALYLSRSRVTTRTVPLVWQKVNPTATTPVRYERHIADAMVWDGVATATLPKTSCGVWATNVNDGSTYCSYPSAFTSDPLYRTYNAHRWTTYLDTATEEVQGSLTVESHGLNASTLIGEAAPVVTGLSVTRSIAH